MYTAKFTWGKILLYFNLLIKTPRVHKDKSIPYENISLLYKFF